jgi:hypothetical protein
MSAKDIDDADEEEVITHQFKIILLGDGAVGKTSIATRFAEDRFSQNYKQTVGVDFFIKRINLQCEHYIKIYYILNSTLCVFSKRTDCAPDMGYRRTGETSFK